MFAGVAALPLPNIVGLNIRWPTQQFRLNSSARNLRSKVGTVSISSLQGPLRIFLRSR